MIGDNVCRVRSMAKVLHLAIVGLGTEHHDFELYSEDFDAVRCYAQDLTLEMKRLAEQVNGGAS